MRRPMFWLGPPSLFLLTLLLLMPPPANAQQMRSVTGNVTVEETATALGISPASVKRKWTLARAWLYRELCSPTA